MTACALGVPVLDARKLTQAARKLRPRKLDCFTDCFFAVAVIMGRIIRLPHKKNNAQRSNKFQKDKSADDYYLQ